MRRRNWRVAPFVALTSLLLSIMVPVAALAVDAEPEPEPGPDATLVFQTITCPTFADVVYNADGGDPDDTLGRAPAPEDRKTSTETGPIATVMPAECTPSVGSTFRLGEFQPARQVIDDTVVYTFSGDFVTTPETGLDGTATVLASELLGEAEASSLVAGDFRPYVTADSTGDARFASLQCQNDMQRLNNRERLGDVEDGGSLYCTAWNVVEPEEPAATTVTVNKSWNDATGTDITSQVTGSAAFSVQVGDDIVTSDLVTSPANGWSDTADISEVAASFDGETVDIVETLTDIAVTDCLNPSVTSQFPDPSDLLIVGEELVLDIVNTVTCETPAPPAPGPTPPPPSVPAGAIPFVGDWNGNGMATPGWFHEATWYLIESPGEPVVSFVYGRSTDVPVVGDWNNSGQQTIGVRRGNRWFLRNSNSGGNASLDFYYGRSSDVPVVGDWNNSGQQTIGVRRGDRWFLRNSNSGGNASLDFNYGRSSDVPVVGDWNNSGQQTIGVVRGASWLLRNSNSGGFHNVEYIYN